ATRMNFGNLQSNPPSRFIGEIPDELIDIAGIGSRDFGGVGGWEKRGDRHGVSGYGAEYESGYGSDRGYGRWRDEDSGRTFGSGAVGSLPSRKKRAEAKAVTFAAGDTVDHKTFGRGTVIRVEGEALYIRFEGGAGEKKLMKGFAPIVKIQS
ncbi:MAG: DNA helicase UvrD, partial [Coriobacteriia bacterium]|nr:DNA helicase UvrD [Coriobacteriia bacterium]